MNAYKLVKSAVVISALAASLVIPSKAKACSVDPLIGSMCAFAGNFSIRNWAKTEGQLLPISQNQALFSILGTNYGGDGRTTFALPDLRGRAAIGAGQGPGLQNVRLGRPGGAETNTLSVINMPQHNHTSSSSISNTVDTSSSEATLRAIASGASTNIPTNTILANSPGRENIYSLGTPNVDMSSNAIELNIVATGTSDVTTTIGQTGGSQAFSIRSPYLAVTWLVALNGSYPSRN